MKKTIIFIEMFLLLIGLAFGHEEDLTAGKDLIDKKVKCDNLTDEQLEHIGDYMMEQMHPGEAHERMDEAMGGEGSDSLKQMHVRMANMMYCGEGNMMQMMDGGMMNMMGGNMMQNNLQQGMMSGWGMNPFWGSLAMLLILAVLVLLIVFLVKKIRE